MLRFFRNKVKRRNSRTAAPGGGPFAEWLGQNTSTKYDWDHQVRFIETFSRLKPYMNENKNWLELGGESRISEYLRTELSYGVDLYGEDLRYPLTIQDNTYDVVLSLEVIEHIKDRHETRGIEEISTFTYSGVRSLFGECYRILRPGGILFMTTPNACSIDAIGRLFVYKSAQGYAPHVKEYSAEELTEFARDSGFRLEEFSTAFVWNAIPEIDRSKIIDTLHRAGIPTHDRGDDMFLVFRK